MINKDQVLSTARWILGFGGGFFVGKGWVTAEQLNTVTSNLPEIVAGAVAVGGFVWGIIRHTDKNNVVAASNVPGVKAVVVDASADTNASAGVVAAAASKDAPKVVPG